MKQKNLSLESHILGFYFVNLLIISSESYKFSKSRKYGLLINIFPEPKSLAGIEKRVHQILDLECPKTKITKEVCSQYY